MDRHFKVTVEMDNGTAITVKRTISADEIKKLEDLYSKEEIPSVLTMICMREAMGASSQSVQVMSETFTDWWSKEPK